MTSWTARVLELEPTFRRAPSAHNTQPATLLVEGESLVVGWEPDRELTVADPTRRDLWLSLGAYVESVCVAGADVGVGVDVRWDVDTRAHRVARLVESAPRPVPGGFTAEHLRARRTARGAYAEPFVDPAAVDRVAAAANLGDDVRVSLVASALVDELLPVADRWSYGSPGRVSELRRWLRLDAGESDYHVDGLTYEALALTSLQARMLEVALSPRAWSVLRRVGGPRLLASASRISARGAVVTLHVAVADAETPEQVCEHGRVLLRTWLAALGRGLHVHPLSQLVDCPGTAARLQRSVSLPGEQRRILSAFRIGRPTTEPVESARISERCQTGA